MHGKQCISQYIVTGVQCISSATIDMYLQEINVSVSDI